MARGAALVCTLVLLVGAVRKVKVHVESGSVVLENATENETDQLKSVSEGLVQKNTRKVVNHQFDNESEEDVSENAIEDEDDQFEGDSEGLVLGKRIEDETDQFEGDSEGNINSEGIAVHDHTKKPPMDLGGAVGLGLRAVNQRDFEQGDGDPGLRRWNDFVGNVALVQTWYRRIIAGYHIANVVLNGAAFSLSTVVGGPISLIVGAVEAIAKPCRRAVWKAMAESGLPEGIKIRAIAKGNVVVEAVHPDEIGRGDLNVYEAEDELVFSEGTKNEMMHKFTMTFTGSNSSRTISYQEINKHAIVMLKDDKFKFVDYA